MANLPSSGAGNAPPRGPNLGSIPEVSNARAHLPRLRSSFFARRRLFATFGPGRRSGHKACEGVTRRGPSAPPAKVLLGAGLRPRLRTSLADVGRTACRHRADRSGATRVACGATGDAAVRSRLADEGFPAVPAASPVRGTARLPGASARDARSVRACARRRGAAHTSTTARGAEPPARAALTTAEQAHPLSPGTIGADLDALMRARVAASPAQTDLAVATRLARAAAISAANPTARIARRARLRAEVARVPRTVRIAGATS